jgi:hypothetical protein
MVPNLDGQRRPPCKQHSKLSNSRRPRRDPRSLPGRWRWCDRPWLCDAQKASALHTLIRQRHPTPSCGGHAPTAERTMIPARMCLESLDRRPGIREQPGSKAAVRPLISSGPVLPREQPLQRLIESSAEGHSRRARSGSKPGQVPCCAESGSKFKRFFNKKKCRRVAKRYDMAANYLAFLKPTSIRIWLRAI